MCVYICMNVCMHICAYIVQDLFVGWFHKFSLYISLYKMSEKFDIIQIIYNNLIHLLAPGIL